MFQRRFQVNAVNGLLTPATLTVLAGSVLSIAVGVTDAGWLHAFGRDVDLIFLAGGVGALLGHNPLQKGVSA
jgi:hypothetical protein